MVWNRFTTSYGTNTFVYDDDRTLQLVASMSRVKRDDTQDCFGSDPCKDNHVDTLKQGRDTFDEQSKLLFAYLDTRINCSSTPPGSVFTSSLFEADQEP